MPPGFEGCASSAIDVSAEVYWRRPGRLWLCQWRELCRGAKGVSFKVDLALRQRRGRWVNLWRFVAFHREEEAAGHSAHWTNWKEGATSLKESKLLGRPPPGEHGQHQ